MRSSEVVERVPLRQFLAEIDIAGVGEKLVELYHSKEKDHIFNYAILYAKYYIYCQKITNIYQFDLYECQAQILRALKIEEIICQKQN